MATPLSEERDLTNIDRLRIGALHVEPPFADEDLLDEITALETEVERRRHELWIASGAADDHAKRAWWNQRVMEMEASDDNATE